MPTPPMRPSPSPSPGPGSAPSSSNANTGPTAWPQDQQAEFLRALMAAPDITGAGRSAGAAGAPLEPGAEAADDPMAAMLNALAQLSGGAPPTDAKGIFPPGAETMQEQKQKTLFMRLRPVVHLFLTWLLLAFFVFVQEPQAYATLPGANEGAASGTYAFVGSRTMWDRWAELGKRLPARVGELSFGVQPLVSPLSSQLQWDII